MVSQLLKTCILKNYLLSLSQFFNAMVVCQSTHFPESFRSSHCVFCFAAALHILLVPVLAILADSSSPEKVAAVLS